jgi:type I restriction enzyme S subunit
MLDLTPDQLRLVQNILATYTQMSEIRVFGSRATGRAKPHSDLDLAWMGDAPPPGPLRAQILEDFDESDLPFRVDLLVYREAPPALRQTIDRESLVIPLRQDGPIGKECTVSKEYEMERTTR